MQAVHRYAMANNPYIGKKFNPKEEMSYLQYLDANSFYGWAMSQSLPTGGFGWVSIEPNEKLVPNLHNKKNYVIHIRALDQALSH